MLLKEFPYLIIPCLPVKKKKESDKSIKKREKYFTRFMQAIMRCEELKSSQFLVQWLTNEDNKDFPKVMKAEEKKKVNKGFEAIKNANGRVPASMI
jgi:hypothetical protein